MTCSEFINACKLGDLELVKSLGDGQDYDGDGGIRHAANNGHLEVVKYLVAKGADIQVEHAFAIIQPAKNGHLEVVKYLVSQGADVILYGNFAVQYASMNGHIEVVKYLISQGANVRTENDFSTLYASDFGHLEIVKYLVSQGSSIKNITQRSIRYLSFCEKMQEKNRIRAQKKIYFWWIQICYDMNHPSGCGKRMAQKNVEEYESMMKS